MVVVCRGEPSAWRERFDSVNKFPGWKLAATDSSSFFVSSTRHAVCAARGPQSRQVRLPLANRVVTGDLRASRDLLPITDSFRLDGTNLRPLLWEKMMAEVDESLGLEEERVDVDF